MILLIIGMAACSKEEEIIKADNLTGEWRWVLKTGGIAGVYEKPKNDEVVILILNSDKTFKYLLNGKETSDGNYGLTKGESILLNKEVNIIVFNEHQKQMYELSGDSLYLSEDFYDGFNYTYVRNK